MKFTTDASIEKELIPFLLYSVEISTSLHGTKSVICAVSPKFNFSSFRNNVIPLQIGETVVIEMDNNSDYGVLLSK